MASNIDSRQVLLAQWLQQQLGSAVALQPLAGDASTRRYFRLTHAGRKLIAMDAPPDSQDLNPFIDIAQRLHQAGLHVPAIEAQQREHGFLLLSDLGEQAYIDVLDPANAEQLMADAIACLVQMQSRTDTTALPLYDRALLQRELDLFPDWYLRHEKNLQPSASLQADLAELFAQLIDSALAQGRVFVHRDYMPRNLMLSQPNPGVIDFQDAVLGPVSYDPICLLCDAFISWPYSAVERWLASYWQQAQAAQLPVPASLPQFLRDCDLMGAQRHLKVIGIFARICHRDGKPRYVKDVPRFVDYLAGVRQRRPELTALGRVMDAVWPEHGGAV